MREYTNYRKINLFIYPTWNILDPKFIYKPFIQSPLRIFTKQIRTFFSNIENQYASLLAFSFQRIFNYLS